MLLYMAMVHGYGLLSIDIWYIIIVYDYFVWILYMVIVYGMTYDMIYGMI